MCRKKKAIVTFLILVLLGMLSSMALGGVVYVDPNAIGNNDGSSWPNAYNILQDALADANSMEKPVEIRVARGVYRPDQGAGITPGDRDATFRLINGVTVKGGYAGYGSPDPEARDIIANETTLSGDLYGNDVIITDLTRLLRELSRFDNSIHVVTASETDASAVLDGFTITAGNAPGSSSWNQPYDFSYAWNELRLYGAGMLNKSASPTVVNCTFRNNAAVFGGGMYNYDGCNPTIENCTFSRNAVDIWGGGMVNALGSSPTVHACTFDSNVAGTTSLWGLGGGVANIKDCSAVFTECTFTANWTVYRLINGYADVGGGMFDWWNCASIIDRCVFVGNSGTYGGALFTEDGLQTVTHSTFSENSGHYGGAIECMRSSMRVSHCTFSGNTTTGGGGAVDSTDSDSQFSNCIFNGNSSPRGGVMWVGIHSGETGSCAMINCTLVDNDTFSIYTYHITPTLENCIVWGNTPSQIYGFAAISFSDVEGGYTGVGNINLAPTFVSRANGDYHLRSQAGHWDEGTEGWIEDDVTSPCIDAGNSGFPIGLEPLPNGGFVNMGAYGGTAEASKSYFDENICEIIVAGDINGDCVVNFADLAILALHWLEDHRLQPGGGGGIGGGVKVGIPECWWVNQCE